MRAATLLETLLPGAMAVAVVIVSFLDFFGVIEHTWIEPRIPAITLLIVGIMLAQYTIQFLHYLQRIDETVANLHSREFASLHERLDEPLKLVFGEHIETLVNNVRNAVQEKKIEISDMDLFRYFYRATLRAYPKRCFVATSLASEGYFWKNPTTEQSIISFIRGGGKMKRIFFLSGRDPEAVTDEECGILLDQLRMGVEVFVIPRQVVPDELARFFLTDTQATIAWEATVKKDSEIHRVTATSQQATCQQFLRLFESLKQLPSIECVAEGLNGKVTFSPLGRRERKLGKPTASRAIDKPR
jgi:hypothetical protein